MNKKIGVFILNYNGIYWLKKNLSNIISHSINASITVIDNNSTDNSIQYLNKNFPSIEIKTNKKNYGFSKGYNKILLTENRFDYFILMNTDIQVTENWIPPLIEKIQQDNIGIIQPKIKNLKSKKLFEYGGGGGGFIDILGIPFCRGRIINTIEEDCSQYNDDRNIFWAAGCCFMIDRKVFQKLSGFDEDLFMHQEEVDLCWRAQGLNKKVYYTSKSTVYHAGGGTLPYHSAKKNYYNHRNSLLLLIKNLSFRPLFLIIILRIILDYIIITAHLFRGIFYVKNVFYIIRAHFSCLKLLKKKLKNRKPIKSNFIYKGSIIFDYYFKRKRKFSELKQF